MAVTTPASAQTEVEGWDVTQPRGETREIDFTTDEGTWMSLDVSPDGRWIVFDLLGHIYRVPAAGGEAQVLTQESGIAVNYHPRVSPDGRFIAFISDRRGQENLWVMEADGSSPRPVLLDDALRLMHPVWAPDGRYIVVERQVLAEPGFVWGLWMYHVDGGTGVELLPAGPARPSWPSVSADGRYLYYHAVDEALSRYADAVRGARQLRRYEFTTGAIVAVTAGAEGRQNHASSGGAYAPEVSPDGRRLAFARRIPDGTISYKGHRFGPRTALWLRDLETGADRLAIDPIEVDMTETGKRLRALPGSAWTPDGRSIVLTQGGKLRRLDVETGEVATIPFRARVRRTISEQARGSTPITDGPFEAKFLRWYTSSPDGRVVLFQAVGKIWAARRSAGRPRRLTDETFAPFEFSPAWSRDGRWVAFTTWDERERGHLWKVRAGGGRPQQLTEQAGEYIHPVWSPDGSDLVVARGAGGTARGRTWRRSPWFDLVRVPAGGGPATFIVREATSTEGVAFFGTRRHALRPSYGPDGRVFYPERWSGEDVADGAIALSSVAPDGTDKRVHLTFPYADDIVTSPDGEFVAFVEGDNVYLVPFPWMKTGSDPVHVEKSGGTLPVRRVSREGGLYPTWIDASTLGFGSGVRFYTYDVQAQATDTLAIHLSIPRDLPTGTIALSGARIVTLDQRRVIERGAVLVRGSRIACVGDCDLSSVDRVVDVTGTTIIPGFVDMHAHHYSEHHGIVPPHNYETAIYLAYGVTTDLDPAAWAQNVFPTAELIEAGKVIGPRAFGTGDPLHRRDGTHWNEITRPTPVDRGCRPQAGADPHGRGRQPALQLGPDHGWSHGMGTRADLPHYVWRRRKVFWASQNGVLAHVRGRRGWAVVGRGLLHPGAGRLEGREAPPLHALAQAHSPSPAANAAAADGLRAPVPGADPGRYDRRGRLRGHWLPRSAARHRAALGGVDGGDGAGTDGRARGGVAARGVLPRSGAGHRLHRGWQAGRSRGAERESPGGHSQHRRYPLRDEGRPAVER
jgi:Tol biopolymer transport system component